jgi:hypothetical protein
MMGLMIEISSNFKNRKISSNKKLKQFIAYLYIYNIKLVLIYH